MADALTGPRTPTRARPQWAWLVPLLTTLVVLAVAAWLWRQGQAYYRLPSTIRPDAPLHHVLDASGSVGHRLGIAGSLMMAAILLYTLRKRLRWLQQAGSLRHWLQVHILFGLLGPVLVTYHTAFNVGGLVAIAYWSMVVTMLSGIFGRYLFAQLPGPLSLADVRAAEEECGALEQELARVLQEQPAAAAAVARWAPPAHLTPARGLLTDVLRADLLRPWMRWRLARALGHQAGLTPTAARRLARSAMRRALLTRRLGGAAAMERLFHHWHVLHRPFVWIMFLVVAVHVGVAVLFGYSGI